MFENSEGAGGDAANGAPDKAAELPPLPAGWIAEKDEDTGEVLFYINAETGDRQMERPEAPPPAAQPTQQTVVSAAPAQPAFGTQVLPTQWAQQGQVSGFQQGWPVSAMWTNGRWYDGGFIASQNPDTTYRIWWPGWGNFSEAVKGEDIKLAPFFKPPSAMQAGGGTGTAAVTAVAAGDAALQKLQGETDPEALFEQLKAMDPYADKGNYHDETDGWDLQGLKDDIRINIVNKGVSEVNIGTVAMAQAPGGMAQPAHPSPEALAKCAAELAVLDAKAWEAEDPCFAKWPEGHDQKYYPGIVKEMNEDGTFRVFWPKWGNDSMDVGAADMMRPAPIPDGDPAAGPTGDKDAVFAPGTDIFGRYDDNMFYPAQILTMNEDGTYKVFWKKFKKETDNVPAEKLVTEIPCPNCGQVNNAGSNFCMSCGFSFGTYIPPAGMGPPQGFPRPEFRDPTFDHRDPGMDRRGRHGRRGVTPLEPRQAHQPLSGTSAFGQQSATIVPPQGGGQVHLW